MEQIISFDILKRHIRLFFEKFNLDYSFKEEYIIENKAIKNHNYKTYNQLWVNKSSILEVRFSITFHEDSSSLINMHVRRYRKTDVLEYRGQMNVGSYLKNERKKTILELEHYSGVTMEEKIDSFFTWLGGNKV